ncbi:unnamed protein product, partial [marine sediment metagenome]
HPDEVVDIISTFLQLEEDGCRILDPCCGTGYALNQLRYGISTEEKSAYSYGVELNTSRSVSAKSYLTKAIKSDFFRIRTPDQAYSLIFLNPPYDDSGDQDQRLEHKFLLESRKYLMPSGILVLIIPQRRLTRLSARHLAAWYTDFQIYKFPGKAYDQFRQIVLFAVRKTEAAVDPIAIAMLQAIPVKVLPDLCEQQETVFTLPPNRIDDNQFYLKSIDLDPIEVLHETEKFGAWPLVEKLVQPPNQDMRGRVLMPLRKGHLAILIACGMCNGIIQKNGT